MPARKLRDDVVKIAYDVKPTVVRKAPHSEGLLLQKALARIDRFMRLSFSWVLIATYAAVPAQARVKKIQITPQESPTFGGYSWPGVGQYEKIVGKPSGELDPR